MIQKHDTYVGDNALIMDWIFYHDTTYKFSIRHWEPKNEDQISLAAQKKIISKAVFSPETQIVSRTKYSFGWVTWLTTLDCADSGLFS